jgi:3-oxoadipate enol-lactonase
MTDSQLAYIRLTMRILLAILFLMHFKAYPQGMVKKVLVDGNGIPIVMLAGGTADISAYAFHAKELSANYLVIRMEHFNVQYATEGLILPKNYSVQTESEAIKYTLDSLNIREPVILVGHSYGGLIALDFALNYPDHVRKLILLEPPVFGVLEAMNESPEGAKKMLDLSKELGPEAEISEEKVERFRCALLNCDSISIRQHPQWPNWVKQKNRLRGLSAVGEYKVDLRKLQSFTKPVLVVTGSTTVAFHKRIDEILVSKFQNSKGVMIPGGHSFPATAPNELLHYLKDFIK